MTVLDFPECSTSLQISILAAENLEISNLGIQSLGLFNVILCILSNLIFLFVF